LFKAFHARRPLFTSRRNGRQSLGVKPSAGFEGPAVQQERAMRSSFTARTGLTLVRSPSQRQLQSRRRLLAVCAVLALALTSGVIGSLTTSSGQVFAHASTGPFSYVPGQ
jgi:hypothetical protein